MNSHPQTNPANAVTNRSTRLVSPRLLVIQPPSLGIAICGPDNTADGKSNKNRVTTTTPPTKPGLPQ